MDYSKIVLYLVSLLCFLNVASGYHEDFTWKDADSMMSSDLKSRMSKGKTSEGIRKYCTCPDVDIQDLDPVCGSNGALYKSVCHFNCAQLRIPSLVEVDDGRCDSMTFKEPKEKKIQYQSHY